MALNSEKRLKLLTPLTWEEPLMSLKGTLFYWALDGEAGVRENGYSMSYFQPTSDSLLAFPVHTYQGNPSQESAINHINHGTSYLHLFTLHLPVLKLLIDLV